jgi:hypothetical protein
VEGEYPLDRWRTLTQRPATAVVLSASVGAKEGVVGKRVAAVGTGEGGAQGLDGDREVIAGKNEGGVGRLVGVSEGGVGGLAGA